MMQRVFKYPLHATGEQSVPLPHGAQILCVQTQRGTPCLWALIDDTAPTGVYRTITIYGTGQPIYRSPGKYIGTFQINDGSLVFHVFDDTAR